eukprot:11269099-Alexandrium_andersonii.AAC.1
MRPISRPPRLLGSWPAGVPAFGRLCPTCKRLDVWFLLSGLPAFRRCRFRHSGICRCVFRRPGVLRVRLNGSPTPAFHVSAFPNAGFPNVRGSF